MHPYTTENTAFWFYLCCSWTVQRLNLTYLVFCGLDLFGSLPEWISLCAGSEEQSGKCAKRSTMGEAVGSVHRYPRICSGCCNTAMCQMTVSESRTPAFSVRVLCAFSWQRVPLDSVCSDFLGLSYISVKAVQIFQHCTLKSFSQSSWIISEPDIKLGVTATKALFALVHLFHLTSHVL